MRVSRLSPFLYVSTVVLLRQAERQATSVEVPAEQVAVTRSRASWDTAGIFQPYIYQLDKRLANMLP